MVRHWVHIFLLLKYIFYFDLRNSLQLFNYYKGNFISKKKNKRKNCNDLIAFLQFMLKYAFQKYLKCARQIKQKNLIKMPIKKNQEVEKKSKSEGVLRKAFERVHFIMLMSRKRNWIPSDLACTNDKQSCWILCLTLQNAINYLFRKKEKVSKYLPPPFPNQYRKRQIAYWNWKSS